MVDYHELADNPFTIDIQNRLADTDAMQHINNAAFVKFLETARTMWHAQVRDDPRSLEYWDWILGGININFKKEAYLSDKLTVKMWCSRIGNKSWDFSYVMTNQNDEVVLEARTSQIAFDYDTRRSLPIAPDLLADLKSRSGKPWPNTP